MRRSPISIETKTGPPQQEGEMTLVVRAQVVRARLPFGEVVWSRPVAVEVRAPGAEPRTLPVIDVTRLAVWALMSFGLAVMLLASAVARRNKEKRHD